MQGLRLFSCEFVDDGKRYGMTVVGESVEQVQELVGRLGVVCNGETVALGEITPDGPRTDWVAPGLDQDAVQDRALDAFG